MNKQDAMGLIERALEVVNAELPEGERVVITPDLRLFGSEASIDSLALVSLIVDVESEVSEITGMSVSLTDDRAISREPSPFSTVETLADYVTEITTNP